MIDIELPILRLEILKAQAVIFAEAMWAGNLAASKILPSPFLSGALAPFLQTHKSEKE